jgi:predicted nuclease with TOPRIM domain|tara:strand:- start:358 stop:978 length:621 start_codon:yes stop_codon:yes gene_type:complete
MSKFDDISTLLPEGLTEDTVTEIANLVSEVISEEVENKVKDLENKVHGFLRMKIDEVKDHAISELEQENETYKNARIFESLKALMSLELNSADDDNAVSQTRREFEEIQEENEVLVRELNGALTECSKMENTLRVLSGKIETLEEERLDLQEAVVSLEESATLPFKSNEKAVVISEQVDEEVAKTVEPRSNNEFINEDMLAFMPKI